MIFKKTIIFSSICFFITFNCTANQYEVIRPASEKELAPIVTLIMENKDDEEAILRAFADFNEIGLIDDCKGLIDYSQAYILDINNDGVEECVFVGTSGSLRFFTLAVFSIVNNKAILLDIPDFSLESPFYNIITDKEELFVKAQDKIYMCGGYGPGGEFLRDISLWENNKITNICNKFWINQQRELFQKLYNKNRFNDAFSLLYDFEKKFRKKIDIKTDLWLRNDIAIAAIKIKKYKIALEILEQIRNEPALNKTTKNFKKALNFNFKMCLEKIEHEKINGTKGEYDYCWLLKNQPELSNCLDELINNSVPEIEVTDIDYGTIFSRLCQYSEVKIKNNRFASFEGWRPYDCLSRALFWCDTKEKTSVIALNSSTEFNILVTSRNLLLEELPQDFFEELDTWVIDLRAQTINKYIFYDRHGKAKEFKR